MNDKEQKVYADLTKAYNRIINYQKSGKMKEGIVKLKTPSVKGEIERKMRQLNDGSISWRVAERVLDYPDMKNTLEECEREGF